MDKKNPGCCKCKNLYRDGGLFCMADTFKRMRVESYERALYGKDFKGEFFVIGSAFSKYNKHNTCKSFDLKTEDV